MIGLLYVLKTWLFSGCFVALATTHDASTWISPTQLQHATAWFPTQLWRGWNGSTPGDEHGDGTAATTPATAAATTPGATQQLQPGTVGGDQNS